MKKLRLATVWLDGCSGCHMSLLDMDTALIALVRRVDIVYGPLVDAQEFPEEVDVTLVEGAVSTQEDVEKLQHIRQHTKVLVSLGDCAVTGNVSGLRNAVPVDKLLKRVYVEGADDGGCIPNQGLPHLARFARPVQDFVKVDVCLPGCPPSNKIIAGFLNNAVEGRKPTRRSSLDRSADEAHYD
jgi:NAD-reducing hydrogenase small subunit